MLLFVDKNFQKTEKKEAKLVTKKIMEPYKNQHMIYNTKNRKIENSVAFNIDHTVKTLSYKTIQNYRNLRCSQIRAISIMKMRLNSFFFKAQVSCLSSSY